MTALAPAAGPVLAAWLGSYTAMTNAMAGAAGVAALAAAVPLAGRTGRKSLFKSRGGGNN
ncbi:hypothetical protein [Arthrobacter sp. UYCu712]|uniref:hypothetical protein n=1 Tax=Arthrobacter sp. UYCu712 TaxID=3156340 RepID=UPI003397BB6A